MTKSDRDRLILSLYDEDERLAATIDAMEHCGAPEVASLIRAARALTTEALLRLVRERHQAAQEVQP